MWRNVSVIHSVPKMMSKYWHPAIPEPPGDHIKPQGQDKENMSPKHPASGQKTSDDGHAGTRSCGTMWRRTAYSSSPCSKQPTASTHLWLNITSAIVCRHEAFIYYSVLYKMPTKCGIFYFLVSLWWKTKASREEGRKGGRDRERERNKNHTLILFLVQNLFPSVWVCAGLRKVTFWIIFYVTKHRLL